MMNLTNVKFNIRECTFDEKGWMKAKWRLDYWLGRFGRIELKLRIL